MPTRSENAGLAGTTVAMGAGAEWDDDYAAQAKWTGATEVVVIPDHDEAGGRFADRYATEFAKAGFTVKVLTLDVGKDVTEWVEAGHAPSELIAMADAAPVWAAEGGTHGAEEAPGAGASPAVGPRAAVARPDPALRREARTRLIQLSTVTPQAVTWLWPGRVPAGKLTLIFGDPEMGKSFFTLDLAARITRGATFPDGTPAPEGSVVILANEDSPEDTIRPRLDDLGGDASRVFAITSTGYTTFSLEHDLPALAEAITARDDTRLVVIDPLSAYIGMKLDTWRDNQVRAVLEPVVSLAERTGVAILGLMHMTKDEKRRALGRIVGSGAFGAVARAAYLVEREPETGRRLFACAKLSIGPKPPTLAYTIQDLGNYRARLVWDPTPLPLDADQVLSGSNDTGEETHDATKLLRDLLGNGEARLVKDVMRVGQENGFSWDALKRAKKRLRVLSEKAGFADAWTWRMPSARKESA